MLYLVEQPPHCDLLRLSLSTGDLYALDVQFPSGSYLIKHAITFFFNRNHINQSNVNMLNTWKKTHTFFFTLKHFQHFYTKTNSSIENTNDLDKQVLWNHRSQVKFMYKCLKSMHEASYRYKTSPEYHLLEICQHFGSLILLKSTIYQ